VSRTDKRAGQSIDPPFDGVDVVAARVEAVTRTSLRVLVAQPVAHRQQHRWTREVLAGDELEVGALIRQLPKNGVGHGGIDSCDSVERTAKATVSGEILSVGRPNLERYLVNSAPTAMVGSLFWNSPGVRHGLEIASRWFTPPRN